MGSCRNYQQLLHLLHKVSGSVLPFVSCLMLARQFYQLIVPNGASLKLSSIHTVLRLYSSWCFFNIAADLHC